MEVTDVIKYFAKFPDREGVLKNFLRTSGDTDYNELKQYITDLPDPLMPLIKDFVVSSKEEEIAERIKNIDNYFLFLEYGPIIAASPNRVRIRKIDFALSVHVCYHDNSKNVDWMQEAIIMDNCLGMAFDLAKQMIADDNEICPQTRFVESSLSFAPIEPSIFYQSIGWSLSFKKSNNTEL
jgi:hypothetical protein